MVRLLIYGYTTGVRSSRAIERKCVDDVAFRFLAVDKAPDFLSIARFRRRHIDALAGLFLQSPHLAQKLGMVKMGRVALDGTKLEANASKHEAMSYGRLVGKEERIEAEIAELEATATAMLAGAEATDTAEDERFGPDGKDTDLPAELDRREKRPSKPKAQANFTDPDSRIMKNSDGAYIQANDAQAVVTGPSWTRSPRPTPAPTPSRPWSTSATAPRRTGPTRTPRTHPQRRDVEGALGPQAADQAGQGRLQPPPKPSSNLLARY